MVRPWSEILEGTDIERPRFFGRRKGKPVTQYQQQQMVDVLARLGVTVEGMLAGTLDPKGLFADPVSEVWFEIGFGKGEHLALQARANPGIGMIGCEPFMNGVARLATTAAEEGLQNIRIYPDDARHILAALKPASLDRVFLLHPDPWPKARHADRRFVNPANLDAVARVLKPGGMLRIGTDHKLYCRWTLMQMQKRTDFRWQVESMKDWDVRPDDWPETRYEKKALDGRAAYLTFIRQA